jgi:hypothetical protein
VNVALAAALEVPPAAPPEALADPDALGGFCTVPQAAKTRAVAMAATAAASRGVRDISDPL